VDESNDRIISIPNGQLVAGAVTTDPNGIVTEFETFFFFNNNKNYEFKKE